MPASKRASEEAEGSARKRLAGPSRTGQACDRCKIRKIRCDARPGGCSPCLQNNTECKTTDRITGRAMSRGHTESLESENNSLKMYMAELQQQLRDNGVEPKQPPSVPPGYMPSSLWAQSEQNSGSWADMSSNGLLPSSSGRERRGSQSSLLPDFRPGCIGDNYLGVASGSGMLSPIEGTRLSLFGMKINLAEFLPPEPDPQSDPMSYRMFLLHALGKTEKIREPPLPNYETCRALADIFFKSVQNFVPVLHKPEFMKLLTQIYHGHYEPNIPEKVMLHMVLVIMNFQMALRNGDEQARVDAMTRYHYCLGFIPDLIVGHQLQDIQALTIICCQLRCQPRCGAVWQFTNMVLGLAIELGLHRSANAWADSSAQDPYTIDMRRRIFWVIMVIHVNISGKLGRPMPLRPEDFDIEVPEQEPDNLPSEANLSKWRKCSYRAAIYGIKLLKIQMQVFSTVYSIRASAEPYETSVRRLEKELQTFREQLPPELSGGPQTVEEDRISALYLKTCENEVRLTLYHPSQCRTMSPEVMAKNMDICLDTSRQLLLSATSLKNLKSLDTTWYYVTDYLAAIFTTLFAWTQRQDQMSSSDLQQLRTDMDAWLDVMGDVGFYLGSGNRLREALRSIIDTSLANISRHLAAKTASASLASSGSPVTSKNGDQPQKQRQMYASTNGYSQSYTQGTPNNHTGNSANQQQFTGMEQPQPQQQNPYPPPNQFYPDPQSGSMPTYPAMGQFDPHTYGEDMKPNIDASLGAHHGMSQQPQPQPPHPAAGQMTPHQAPSNFMAAFQQPVQNGFHPEVSMASYSGGPAAWRSFADDMMTSMGGMNGQEYMASANALMALGGDKQHGMDMAATAGMGGLQLPPDVMPPDGQPLHWPMVQYHHHSAPG